MQLAYKHINECYLEMPKKNNCVKGGEYRHLNHQKRFNFSKTQCVFKHSSHVLMVLKNVNFEGSWG